MLQNTPGNFTVMEIKAFIRVNYRMFRVRIVRAFHIKLALDEPFEC